MKLVKSILICVLASAALSSNASALEEKMASIYWSVAVPKNDMATFVDETSLGGFGIAGRWFVSPRISLGLAWEWQVFDQESTEPINTTLDGFPVGVTISGKQFRYINAFPFLATGYLHIGRAGATRIYAGGGAGAYYMMERFEIGVIALEEKNWRWGVAPEAGLLMPIGDVYGHQNIVLAGKVNLVLGDEDRYDYTWWEINIGLTWNPDF
jgi:hypothetical protein